MPEGQENNELDGDNLEKGFLFSKVDLELDVELDDEVHGEGDSYTFDNEDPDVSKEWAVGRLAKSTEILR